MARRLTLIAGSGALPALVLAAAREHGDEVQVLALGGRTDLPGSVPAQPGNPQAIIAAISAFSSTHVTLAGGVHLGDAERVGLAKAFGAGGGSPTSDGALSALGQVLAQKTGAHLLAPHEVAADLLAKRGHVGGPELDAQRLALALLALRKAKDVGALDLGQAVVVSGHRIIAAEDIAGTDALLRRVKGYRDAGFAGGAGQGLVLAKCSKPNQPLSIDLPAIGPDTVVAAQAAGVDIIVIEAAKTLLLERESITALANKLGVSVIAMDVADG